MSAVYFLQGDCREVLAGLQAERFRALITDPPYGMGYRTNRTEERGRAVSGDGSLAEATELLQEMLDVAEPRLCPDAWMYLFCGAELRDWVVRQNGSYYDEVIWAKPVGSGDTTGQRYRPAYERILVLRQGGPVLHGHPGNLIWGDRPGRVAKQHPMQKDLYGLAEILMHATLPGEWVLDPFAGSGSLAMADWMFHSESERRNFVLIEQDAEIYAAALLRLRRVMEVKTEWEDLS